jgi:tetratricopeptide (TPR) repeat protein
MISPEERKVLDSFAERIPQDDAGAHNNLAIVYYGKGLYDEAIDELEKALKLNPNFVLARNNLEIILRKTGRLEEKVEQLSQIIEKESYDEKKILDLANTYVKLNKHSHAIIYYKKVLDANPDSYEAHYGLGMTLKHLGKYNDALDEMNQAVALKSTHEVFRALGEIYLRKGVVDMAIRNLEQAIDIDNSSAEAYFLLGFALGEKGRAHESIAAVKKAIALNPALAQGETNIPVDVVEHREHWEFLKDQLGIPKSSGDSYQIHYNMGMSYRNKGLFDEAEREFNECLKIREGDAELYYGIAEADIFLGKFVDAIHNLQRALQRDFDAVMYANALGIAYMLQSQFSSALEWFEKVLVQDANDGNALNNIAVAQYNLGDVDQALRNYEKAVDTGNTNARFNLAMHHLKSADYDKALALLNYDTTDAYFGRGLVYMQQGDDEKALNSFRHVLETVPHHAGAYYNMGFIATRQGRYEDSLVYIRKGMEIEPNYDNEKYQLSLDSTLSEFGPYYIPKLHAPSVEIIDKVIIPKTIGPEEMLVEAESLLGKGDVDNALARIDAALSVKPEFPKAVLLKAQVLYHHENQDAAVELLEKYRREIPNSVEILESLANISRERGRLQEAKDVYTRLSELEPEKLSWLNQVADLTYSLGQEAEALNYYRRIYERDRENVDVNLRLLRMYIDRGEYDRASEFLAFFDEKHQDIYEYNILAGIYWSEKKEYEKALARFEKAIEIDSSQPLPYYHEGLLNVQRGAFDVACENWKKALFLSPPDDLADKIRHCLNLTVELSGILERDLKSRRKDVR